MVYSESIDHTFTQYHSTLNLYSLLFYLPLSRREISSSLYRFQLRRLYDRSRALYTATALRRLGRTWISQRNLPQVNFARKPDDADGIGRPRPCQCFGVCMNRSDLEEKKNIQKVFFYPV